jgi:hypothetical protein
VHTLLLLCDNEHLGTDPNISDRVTIIDYVFVVAPLHPLKISLSRPEVEEIELTTT